MNEIASSNKTTYLGDKKINRVGYGTMQLAGPEVFGPPPDPGAARALLRRAVELGVDHIDTAQYYGPDVVNELVREALHPYPTNLKLVTKVGARRDQAGGWLSALTTRDIREGVEENLRTLRVECLDLVNLRLPDHGEVSRDQMAEQFGVLDDLRRQGKVDLIGVSNADLDGIEVALELVEISQVQNSYSIMDRGDDPILDLCRERGIAFVPFYPLGSAFAGGPGKLARDPAIGKVAGRHGATASQVALAWLLARYERMLLIPGTNSMAHLEENLAAIELELSGEDLAQLESAGRFGRPGG